MGKAMGWVLALALLALGGAGVYVYLDQSKRLRELERLTGETASAPKVERILGNLQGQINDLRNTVGQITADYAAATKVSRALDNLQAQINGVRNDVGNITRDYSPASKVNPIVADLRKQIAALKTDLAAARQPAPTYVV
jgi:hypothetical protein